MRPVTISISQLLLIALLLLPGFMVQADRDHDEVRRMHSSGDILSLEQILDKLRQSHPGKVLEVELETEAGITVYEIELLGDDGIVRELYIDARTGELLHYKRDD